MLSLQKKFVPHARCTSPRVRLSDSHILKPQCCTELDAPEVIEAPAHHLGTGLPVVAGPSAEAANDPGREGKRAFGMRILLKRCVAFELGRDRLENALIFLRKGIGQRLAARAVA